MYSDNLSFNPTLAYNFYVKLLLKRTKINKKKPSWAVVVAQLVERLLPTSEVRDLNHKSLAKLFLLSTVLKIRK